MRCSSIEPTCDSAYPSSARQPITQRWPGAMAWFKKARSFVLAALLCITSMQGAGAETLRLRYGQAYSAARSIFSLPVAIADREGFFAREGLKVELLQPIP